MCDICNIKPGEYDDLMEVDAAGLINNGINLLNGQTLGVSILREEDGTYTLESNYWVCQGETVATLKIPIDYCPWCGEKLPKHKKIKLGK